MGTDEILDEFLSLALKSVILAIALRVCFEEAKELKEKDVEKGD